ncbi:DUF4965 domain-containing protein [Niabella terrae]
MLWCQAQERKAPSYPLITHDPYFSIWSDTDQLPDAVTKHWTGADQSLTGFLSVDGKLYRFLGKEETDYQTVLPVATEKSYTVSYTVNKPAAGWKMPVFNEAGWKKGPAPFGDDREARTSWQTDDLWVRRSFTLTGNMKEQLYLKIRHDDNITVYLNGVEIYKTEGWIHKYKYIKIPKAASLLKKGGNVLAVHIRNTAGGRHLDFGLVREKASRLNAGIQPAVQQSVNVSATQTSYTFNCGPVDLDLKFTSPLVINDLDLLARPVSYISYKVRSRDRRSRDVKLLLTVSSDLAVNTPDQEVAVSGYQTQGLSVLKTGTLSQDYLKRKGDDVRIDWGYLYVAVPQHKSEQFVSRDYETALQSLKSGKTQPLSTEKKGKRFLLNTLTKLNVNDPKESHLLLGYDDIWSIQYFGTNLRPWWNQHNNTTMDQLLVAAQQDYDATIQKCKALDERIYKEALQAGGEDYARLCEISYRQVMAAHKLVRSPQGDLLWLSKENFSNGCINTVDLTYPSAPLFLVYNPDLEKGMMNGIFYYSESGRWKKPFAAHDLGTYPQANGQVYGEDMPVEESGNMIILAAAIARMEGNADYAKQHWQTLTTWTDYLVKEGFDPANQLCTDDFAGHLARNANLSLKAIMGIESYAYLAKMMGETDIYNKYHGIAVSMVPKWMQLADDGDHYSLAFEKKGTWSQKYNLIWDRVLRFHIFPEEVFQKEMKFYLNHLNKYGLPLDSRKTYTKSDWTIWTACLTGNDQDFKRLAGLVYKYAIETPTRVPLSDWYETTTGSKVGFQARSVIGGHWMKVLDHQLNQ